MCIQCDGCFVAHHMAPSLHAQSLFEQNDRSLDLSSRAGAFHLTSVNECSGCAEESSLHALSESLNETVRAETSNVLKKSLVTD